MTDAPKRDESVKGGDASCPTAESVDSRLLRPSPEAISAVAPSSAGGPTPSAPKRDETRRWTLHVGKDHPNAHLSMNDANCSCGPSHWDWVEVVPASALDAAERERDFWKAMNEPCENGHHKHDECGEQCWCWGQGKSRIEKAEQRADDAEEAVARLTRELDEVKDRIRLYDQSPRLEAEHQRAVAAENERDSLRDQVAEAKADLLRLTRELESEKLRSDQFGDTTARLLDERDALREVVENLIAWHRRHAHKTPTVCDCTPVKDALAALERKEEK